jgi:hypothetical protein
LKEVCQRKSFVGTGVICETWALEAAVIPAKAGIYSANLCKCAVVGLDSRFRGNDAGLEWTPIPNDTSSIACLPTACTRIRKPTCTVCADTIGCHGTRRKLNKTSVYDILLRRPKLQPLKTGGKE